MLRGVEQLGCLLLCGLAAWAQEDQKVIVNVKGFRYPAIARSARIQGDVVLDIAASEPRLIRAAPPILTEAARKNLDTWTLPPLEGGKYLVFYHFSQTDPGTKPQAVLIGNKFDRLFLRLFHAPTSRVEAVCDDTRAADTQVRQAVTREGDNYVIEVFATSKAGCPYLYAP
jgi:hypothetical protein